MPKLFLFLCFFWASQAFAQMPLDSLTLAEQMEFSDLSAASLTPQKVYRLNLAQANLTEFPEDILQFENLQILYLGSHMTTEGYFEKGSNRLKTLPASIARLKNLQQLYLDDNLLENLPEEIGDLPNLELLSVATNRLKTLPASIARLTRLRKLTLSENNLSVLPEGIQKLSRLQALDLYKNNFQVFPVAICALTNLQDLSISHNQIRVLPADISRLRNLKGLQLAHNRLSVLPAELDALTQLQALNVGENALVSLPASIGQLTGLLSLDLSDNQLTSLPKELTNLGNLEELRAGNNRLTALPKGLEGLVSLRQLILSQNRLTTLPADISDLIALESLELSQNQLTSLPETLGELAQLQSLAVNQNRLATLPRSLGDLPNLKTLSLERNQLQTLPTSFDKMPKLRRIELTQNPLKHISIPFLKRVESADWLMLNNLEKDMQEQYINKHGRALFAGLRAYYKENRLRYVRLLNYGAWIFKEHKQYEEALELGKQAHQTLLSIERDSAKVLGHKPELQNEINETRYKLDTNVKAIKAIKDILDLQARVTRYTQIGAMLLVLFIGLIAFLTYRNARAQKAKNRIIEAERAKSETLLLNILPKDVAQELKETGETAVRLFPHATILFADVRGFSRYASRVTPQQLVNELNMMFTQMDNYALEHKLERIKTIGDCYMAVGGCPEANTSNPVDACLVALKIQHWMVAEEARRGGDFWQVRLGLHTGELVAGVVGKVKFAFDVWGGAVNIASRMESGGEVGKVNISVTTYEFVQDFFECTYRGEIEAKNIGAVKTYFVNRIKPELSEDTAGLVPNAQFKTLYEGKFGAK